MKDQQTSDFYAREANAYTAKTKQLASPQLSAFMARLEAGAAVLELGCGSGRDSEALLAAGFDVIPTDGTPEMAAIAETRLGRAVKVLLFEDIADVDTYDGVWANACLLHVPREQLPSVIGRIHTALRRGGVFYASYKTSGEEGRDQFGRYYNRPNANWLKQVYELQSWSNLGITKGHEPGYFGEPSDWLYVTAIKA
ncbi:MAG: class I SAM-dependent methyltransferase [Rhizobiaceae bacterium]